jgi:hypothetical protein
MALITGLIASVAGSTASVVGLVTSIVGSIVSVVGAIYQLWSLIDFSTRYETGLNVLHTFFPCFDCVLITPGPKGSPFIHLLTDEYRKAMS